jgi:MtN3 and saliva related transmembrane protein
MSITLLGIIAGIFTCSAFIPQVTRAYRTKSVKDLSWGLAIFYLIGVSLWLTYGIMIHDTVIIVANAFSLLSASLLIIAKIKYRKI